MIVGHGVDVADIERVRKLLAAMEEDFLVGTFTPAERSADFQEPDRASYFAGRLAAKEAVVKALGTGFAGDISWQHVEIHQRDDGQRLVRLKGAARAEAERLGIDRWFLSISHTEAVAFASAIAIREQAAVTPADSR
jgi:holo-[acyl-carrier protein] synthase